MTLDVRIGINPISWSNDDLPSLGGETSLETALSEGAAIGYQGFELGNKFPREPAALREVLAPHGLPLVSGWYSGRLAKFLRRRFPVRRMKKHGGRPFGKQVTPFAAVRAGRRSSRNLVSC